MTPQSSPRSLLSIGVAATLCALASPASAQLPERRESPQHVAIDLKFGPYVPSIDRSAGFNGATPFSDFFGDVNDAAGTPPSRGLLGQGEIDYQFFNRFGTLGIGITGGYYRRSAPAFQSITRTDGSVTPLCRRAAADGESRRYETNAPTAAMVASKNYTVPYESCISGDEVVFNLVPVSLLLVYRFDVLTKRFRVPLIPYMKVGFGAYFWWIGNSASFVTQVGTLGSDGTAQNVDASGATYGLMLHPGIALDLSALDPHAAWAIDQELGLNRVSLFVELNGAFMSGWAQKNKLDLSDTTLNAGITFEF